MWQPRRRTRGRPGHRAAGAAPRSRATPAGAAGAAGFSGRRGRLLALAAAGTAGAVNTGLVWSRPAAPGPELPLAAAVVAVTAVLALGELRPPADELARVVGALRIWGDRRPGAALARLAPTLAALLDADVVAVFAERPPAARPAGPGGPDADDAGPVLVARHLRPGASTGWPAPGPDATGPTLAELVGSTLALHLASTLAAGRPVHVPDRPAREPYAGAGPPIGDLASILVAPLGREGARGLVLVGWTRPAGAVAAPVAEAVGLLVDAAVREHQREQQVEKMSRDARTDALTGLLNRRAVDEELARLEPGDVVALIDPDHLRRVNERGGQPAGDRTLRGLAACLADFCRRNDWCGRYGEEEFLLVVRRSGSQPARAVERLRLRWQALEPLTTFSAGVAVHRADVEPGQTVAHAEAALQRAKDRGRDRVEVHARSEGDPGAGPRQ